MLTWSSPRRWYIRCLRSSISRRLVSWVRLHILINSATHESCRNAYLKTSMNPWADWGMFNEVDALGSRVMMPGRERTLMYLSFDVWNWSAPAVSRTSS